MLWGTAEDSSPSFSPNRVREEHSQNVSGEGSLFNVSPLSPGLIIRPTREGGAAPSEGVLLPTMLDDFDDSVLGDPISYTQIELYARPVALDTDHILNYPCSCPEYMNGTNCKIGEYEPARVYIDNDISGGSL